MTFKTDDWNGPYSPTQVDDVTRALPHAVGPEKSLLSSMLQDSQEYIGVAIEQKLTAEHFYLPAHSILFGVLCEIFAAGKEVELVSLVQHLLDRGLLDKVGGPSTLTDIYTYAPSPGHFRHHLRHVKDKFVLRSIIQNSNEAIAQAYDAPDEVESLLDSIEGKLLAIRQCGETAVQSTIKSTVNEIVEDMQNVLRGQAQSLGLDTGFGELTSLGCRLKPGEMFVIAARPSMGKTSFMMNIVEWLAIDEQKNGLVFSLEMTQKQLLERLIYSRAKAIQKDFVPGYTSNRGELQRIQRAALEVAGAKTLQIDATGGITISQLRAVARRKHRECPLEWMAIDYLQLMRSTTKQAASSREREIAEISAGIKGLAKELNVPIILLAQLNRGPEARTGKHLGKPRMSDLRESGSIEQDADMVGLLYRAAYYAEDDDAKALVGGKSELVLAKNRNGATGSAHFNFINTLMRFENGAPYEEEQADLLSPKSRFDD